MPGTTSNRQLARSAVSLSVTTPAQGFPFLQGFVAFARADGALRGIAIQPVKGYHFPPLLSTADQCEEEHKL